MWQAEPSGRMNARSAVSAWMQAARAKRGSPVWRVAQNSSGMFIMQSMMAYPRCSKPFHARM